MTAKFGKVLVWKLKQINKDVKKGKGSIGLLVPTADRNKYFKNDKSPIVITLFKGNEKPETFEVILKPKEKGSTKDHSFWTDTIEPEFSRGEIKAWADTVFGLNNFNDGFLPNVLVWVIAINCFAIQIDPKYANLKG